MMNKERNLRVTKMIEKHSKYDIIKTRYLLMIVRKE